MIVWRYFFTRFVKTKIGLHFRQKLKKNATAKSNVDHIETTAHTMKEVLNEEVKNKPIAVVMDIASENSAILQINTQYIFDKRIVL